jgi:hypothetical protein
MRRKLLIILFLLFGAPVSLAGTQRSAKVKSDGSKVLARPVAGMEATDFSIVSGLEVALSFCAAPGGVVVSRGCGNTEKTFHLGGTTLGAVLKSLTKADPRYRWAIEDGVVNLLPKKGVPPLLKVKIKNFDVNDAPSMMYAKGVLASLPEYREAVKRLGLVQGGFAGSASFDGMGGKMSRKRPSFQVHLHNATVLSVLNAIVRARKRGVWIYTERHCKGERVFWITFSEQ